jgi:hypothetical protein
MVNRVPNVKRTSGYRCRRLARFGSTAKPHKRGKPGTDR